MEQLLMQSHSFYGLNTEQSFNNFKVKSLNSNYDNCKVCCKVFTASIVCLGIIVAIITAPDCLGRVNDPHYNGQFIMKCPFIKSPSYPSNATDSSDMINIFNKTMNSTSKNKNMTFLTPQVSHLKIG